VSLDEKGAFISIIGMPEELLDWEDEIW